MLDRGRPWTDEELNDAIWELTKEFPEASMLVCSHAVEYCRSSVPAGSLGSLRTAMRERLLSDPALKLALPHFRRERSSTEPAWASAFAA